MLRALGRTWVPTSVDCVSRALQHAFSPSRAIHGLTRGVLARWHLPCFAERPARIHFKAEFRPISRAFGTHHGKRVSDPGQKPRKGTHDSWRPKDESTGHCRQAPHRKQRSQASRGAANTSTRNHTRHQPRREQHEGKLPPQKKPSKVFVMAGTKTAYVEVVGTAHDTSPALYLFTQDTRYLFNCGEGTRSRTTLFWFGC